ncbi:TRIM2 [Branchiostoma lanceolatum]|uniref:RING-type E3 ubiquitin transferase n=1 Tax=Branchiostoma lanceolatum TaxID=7740 RepID=A0A8J9VDM8_BRALA|nr:TRIM2 [Branchiostoma lanceolatum]
MAAASSSSLESEFGEELKCSICLELFTRPKVLPCQHTFCQDCLQDHAGWGGTFQCPNCRQQVGLPRQGVAGLPDNLMAANMCERLQKQTTISGDQGNQALITKGKKILGTYTAFFQGLREQEETLKKQKQQIANGINQAYNQMVQSLRQRKEHLLADAEKQHKKNIKVVQDRMVSASADVNELSAACNRAEQEMKQGVIKSSRQETTLSQVIRKYKGKAATTPVQTQPVVFEPTDTPVPVLGHVTIQSLPSAPIPAAPVTGASAQGPRFSYQNQSQHQDGRVTISGYGHHGQGRFERPSGVAVSDSEEGEIFVADSSTNTIRHRVQVFTLQGTFVREVPTVVSGGQEMEPHDVAIDGEGNLWVVGKLPGNSYQAWSATSGKKKGKACPTEFAVQYDKQGRVLRKFDLQQTRYDRAIAVDTRSNHILITQTTVTGSRQHGTVQVFTPEKRIRTVGQHQVMVYPQHITVDWEGNILVSDYNGHAIYMYNKTGEFVCRFGDEGSDEGQLKHPCGICTDRDGNIIVADSGNRRVELFDRKGKFIRHITSSDPRTTSRNLHIGEPHAVAMAPQGQLVITSKRDNKVNIFYKY